MLRCVVAEHFPFTCILKVAVSYDINKIYLPYIIANKTSKQTATYLIISFPLGNLVCYAANPGDLSGYHLRFIPY